MSGSIGGIGSSGNFGFNAALVSNANNVHQELDKLTEQASTGLVAQTYAGLGRTAGVALNLSPQITALQTYQANISQASGSMQITQTAMSQIQQIATTFVADMPNLNGLNSSEVDNIASNARDALRQVANLLDSQNGSAYVFAGQDSGNPPVPDADNILSSGFFTQINAVVSGLSTNGAAATTAATLAIASSNATGTSPFSAYLSQPGTSISGPAVQVNEGTIVQTGLLASANVAAPSTGSSTTGSYMRDLLRGLATLGSMTSAQTGDSSFSALVQDTATSLNGAVTAMDTEVGVLGTKQSSLTQTQTQLGDTTTALQGQVSNAQDADMAATLSNLTATQTQLQESYKLITTANSMSLVNFLPAA